MNDSSFVSFALYSETTEERRLYVSSFRALRGLIFIFAFCIGVIVCADSPQSSVKKYRILKIDSNSASDSFCSDIDNGFREYLNKKGISAALDEYKLGINARLGANPSNDEISAISAKLKASKYNLIMLCNNAAADLFLNGTVSAPAGVPVLISSYHGPLEIKLSGKENIAGIVTKNLWLQNRIFASRLLPKIKAFAIVADAGADGKAQILEYLKAATENRALMNIPVMPITGQECSTDEMFDSINVLPKDSAVLFLSWSSVKDKKHVSSNRVLSNLKKSYPGLVLGKYESYIHHGVDGGVVNSGYRQGELAGKMAEQLLAGIKPSVLPVLHGPTDTFFMHNSARRLGIPVDSIPTGIKLISSPLPFFERFRMEFIFGSVICILILVLYIAALHFRRRQAKRVEEILLTASEMAEMVYFRSDLEGKITVPVRNPHFWPMQNEKSVPAEMWIFPEYMEEYRAAWKKLTDGETDSISIMYAAGAPEQKYYFEMRIRKIMNTYGNHEFFGIIQDITVNRKNEMRYRDNVKLLDTIIDNLPGYLFVKNVNDNFRYMFANNRLSEMLGIPKNQIVGHFDNEIFSHVPEVAAKYNEDDAALLKSDTPLSLREDVTDMFGRKYAVQTVKSTISLSDGSTLLLGIGIDISKLCELEEKQKATIQHLDAAARVERIVNESLTRVMTAPDFDTAITDMLKIIGENSGADRCHIFRYTAENLSRASNEYEWNNEEIESCKDSMQNVLMPDIPAWKEQIESETAIDISDVADLPEKYFEQTQLLRTHNVRSLLAAGIRIDGKIYGFVSLDFVREQKIFTDSDINLVYSIVNIFRLARERFQQLNQIADSVAIQRQIFEHVPSPVILCAPDGSIVAGNPLALKYAGKTEEEVVGHKCCEIFCRNSEMPEWCPMQHAIDSGSEIRIEHTIQGRQHLIVTRPIYDSNGKIIYILELANDITEVTAQREQLRLAMEKAQAADRAKSCFLASISHELRTPLNSIIGFSELLQNEKISPAEKEDYINSIQSDGCNLMNLINDILDLTKLEADRIEITPLKTDILSLLRETAFIFDLKAKQKNLELSVSAANLPPLYVDTMRIRQILVNLIGNGVKFTEAGYVKVSAVFSPKDDETGDLTVEISDTGIGISKECLNSLFVPFANNDTVYGQRTHNGTGLGLSVSKRLAEKMGGSISVASTEGKGSTFTLLLPGIRYEIQKNPVISSENKRRIRVVAVDDVPLNLKVLQAMVKRAGWECMTFSSAKEALEHLKKDSAFDAVLTDLWMPDMDGTEFAAAIKEEPELARIPVFAVTADLECDENFDLALFSGKLTKPISPVALESLLANIEHTEK